MQITVGRIYRIPGLSIGRQPNQYFLIDAIKDFYGRQDIVCGRRWVQSRGRFSGQSYQLAQLSKVTDWQEIESEDALPRR